MSPLDLFWKQIDDQLDAAAEATTVDQLMKVFDKELLAPEDRGSGEAFFAGSGGDRQLLYVLDRRHWTIVIAKATYWWVARDSNGNEVTYCEGDLDRGNGIAEFAAKHEDQVPS